jgi:hypothetical protein
MRLPLPVNRLALAERNQFRVLFVFVPPAQISRRLTQLAMQYKLKKGKEKC